MPIAGRQNDHNNEKLIKLKPNQEQIRKMINSDLLLWIVLS